MIDFSSQIKFWGFFTFLFYFIYVSIVYVKIMKHIKVYQKVFKNYFNPDKESIEIPNYLSNWDDTISKELKFVFGEKRNDELIKNIILKDIKKDNYYFLTLINIFPAIGLIFTFGGLFITLETLDYRLFDDLISSNIFVNIISSIKHLAPVFLFGLVGILLYAVGLWIYSGLERNQDITADELNLLYHQFEEKYFPLKVFDLDQVYNKLLKPLSLTLSSLNKININFQNLGEQIAKYVEKIEENSKILINNLGEISIKMLDRFESESTKTIENFTSKINEFSNNVNKIIETNSNIFKSFETQSNAVIFNFEIGANKLNELTDKIGVYNSKISILSEKINDFKLFLEQLIKFNENFPLLQNEINKNTDTLSKNFELLSHSIKGLDDVKENLVQNVTIIEKLTNQIVSLVQILDKYNLESITLKVTEFVKANQEELLKFLRENITKLNKTPSIDVKPQTVTTVTSNHELSEILEKLKEINDILKNFTKLKNEDGKLNKILKKLSKMVKK